MGITGFKSGVSKVWQGKGHKHRQRAIKDTYTFLINYLLLSQLRDAAELLLLLPVRAGLRRLPTSVLLRTTARLSTTAAKSTITILAAEAGSTCRLLLLEVSEGCEDVLRRGDGVAIGSVGTTFGVPDGSTVGGTGPGGLLTGEDVRLGLGDILVDLLELQE